MSDIGTAESPPSGISAGSPPRTNTSVAATVDVLIAARDRSDTIERAVLSALVQTEVRTVFVVDDGSSDDTAARRNNVILREIASWSSGCDQVLGHRQQGI